MSKKILVAISIAFLMLFCTADNSVSAQSHITQDAPGATLYVQVNHLIGDRQIDTSTNRFMPSRVNTAIPNISDNWVCMETWPTDTSVRLTCLTVAALEQDGVNRVITGPVINVECHAPPSTPQNIKTLVLSELLTNQVTEQIVGIPKYIHILADCVSR